MPPLEETDREQAAILWPFAAYNSFGEVEVGEPVELFPPEGTGVDWLWARADIQSPDGHRIVYDAVVLLDRFVEVGSEMWLAPDPSLRPLDQYYGDGTAPGTSGEAQGICYVVEARKIPDLRGRTFLYEARLARKHFSTATEH